MGRSDKALAVICIWDHFFEMFQKTSCQLSQAILQCSHWKGERGRDDSTRIYKVDLPQCVLLR